MRNPPHEGNRIHAHVAASFAELAILLIWVGNPDASSVLTVGYWLLLTVQAMALVRACAVSMFCQRYQLPSLQMGFIA
ncbi:hypothetical protein [Aeromonas veronii]|uniref:hypothetical protein n=1 Tax=Aeromonas veronii TaxID=654 RepID=UPI0011168DA9|nr:hypothetical protein [Aeromonas veronii]